MRKYKIAALLLSLAVIASTCNSSTVYAEVSLPTGQNGNLKNIANYSTGLSNADGGVAEIVAYNPDNQKMYVVNGAVHSVDIVSLNSISSYELSELSGDIRVDATVMGEENGFSAGDITSVDINTKLDIIALAVQNEDYRENGSIVLLDYDGNYITHYAAGVQPDMVIFSPDGNFVLSADEGEPREGYTAEGAVDPKGSVTLIDLSEGITDAVSQVIDFTAFDSQRDQLINDQVLLKTGAEPSVDLEPEYISITEDNNYAYVTLQEANSIATLDLSSRSFTSIKGLGFKDHNLEENSIDVFKDDKAEISTQDLYGVYMPDGCATINIEGVQYLLTANEGDSREWGEEPDIYADETEINITVDGKDYEVVTIDNTTKEGLDADKQYLFGARSFSIWNAEDMSQVYDSANEFETITSKLYPDYFNSSNDKVKLDSRSPKKGPEPEGIDTLSIDGKYYAFIGFERIGGIVMYDVTEVSSVTFIDYINLRDFTGTDVSNSGALGPEGICTVTAENSPNGKPLVLVANEVSGTVNVFEVLTESEEINAVAESDPSIVDASTADILENTAVETTTESSKEEQANGEIPKTGEAEGVLLLSASGMLGLAFLLRKRNNKEQHLI